MTGNYSYFPGCSVHSMVVEYGRSGKAVCRSLGFELSEIPDWVCCGATPTASYDYEIMLGLGQKNLGKVKAGESVVTPCSACFKNLKSAEEHLKENCQAAPRVQHLFQMIYGDAGMDAIRGRVTRPLKGLKVASYYGCLLTRIDPSFDSAEDPRKMDELVTALGAEAVPFAYKMKCCGGPVVLSKQSLAVSLAGTILKAAKESGADAVVVLCPMCGMMLDLYQKEALKGRTGCAIPVVYFTQLMALAFGLKDEDVALDMNFVSTKPIIEAVAGGGR